METQVAGQGSLRRAGASGAVPKAKPLPRLATSRSAPSSSASWAPSRMPQLDQLRLVPLVAPSGETALSSSLQTCLAASAYLAHTTTAQRLLLRPAARHRCGPVTWFYDFCLHIHIRCHDS